MHTPSDHDAIKRVRRRVLPIAMLLFFVSLLDRSNISFAAIEMRKALDLSASDYGLAAGIFYIGYVLFEIPSNRMLERIGPKIWLPRIVITWGLVVFAMAFVETKGGLYFLRFLLGFAEAGLLPGLLFFLSLWLPSRERGLAYGTLMSTTAIAYAVGGPLTTLMMELSLFGLSGWQTMFLIQGALTVMIGIAAYAAIPSRLDQVNWLSREQREALIDRLAEENASKAVEGLTAFRESFRDRRVWIGSAICFFMVCANFGAVLWLPQVTHLIFSDLSIIQVSLLLSVAFAIGGLGGVILGKASDGIGDRKWYVVGGMALGSLGFGVASVSAVPLVQFISICAGVLGVWSTFGVFWAYMGDLLGGAAAASGFALVSSIGSVGGIVAPMALGVALEMTDGVAGVLLGLAAFSTVTSILASLMRTGPVRWMKPAAL